MEWSDDALILGVQKYGETDAIIDVLTKIYGRQRGFVKGGLGRRLRGVLQPGNGIVASWRARLEANLGSFTVELVDARAADLFENIVRLSGMSSTSNLLINVLPERESCTHIYYAHLAILNLLCDHKASLEDCGVGLTLFESGLLTQLGFGLDLSCCASTGKTENLFYISPKSARAISKEAGIPYHDKLYVLPKFMTGESSTITYQDIYNGLRVTGYFMERHVLNPVNKVFSEARYRFLDHFRSEND
ncbi:MAG: DNA repair protein RecO [Sphingomonadales bacterium]|jgi:DNA repair protein RecO (recombination protein O)